MSGQVQVASIVEYASRALWYSVLPFLAISPSTTGTVGSGTARCDSAFGPSGRWGEYAAHRRIVEAAQHFADRASVIGEVKAVVLDFGDSEPQIVTYIAGRDVGVRSRVYAIEREVHRSFPELAIDFRVKRLDANGQAADKWKARASHVLLSRV